MLRAIIVDDEKLDRIGLSLQIDWVKYNVEIVGLACDAYEALDLLELKPVDILITDVKMPGMSGHELLEAAKVIYSDLEFVFISGYDDFDYVKKALQQEAVEYILKPVNTNELINAIRRVVEKVNKKQKDLAEKNALIQSVNAGSAYAKEKLLKDLIYGVINKESMRTQFNKWNISFMNSFFNVTIIEFDHNVEGNKSPLKTKIIKLIDKTIESKHDKDIDFLYLVDEGDKVILIASSNQTDEKIFYINMRKTMLVLYKTLSQELIYSKVTMAIGKQEEELSLVSKSYKNASEKLLQQMLYGKGQIYEEEINQVSTIDREQVTNIVNEIINTVMLLDDIKLNHLVNHLFDYLRQNNIYKKTFLQDICLNMISRIQIKLNERGFAFKDIFDSNEIVWEKLMKFETILDIRQWIKNVMRSIIEYMISSLSKDDNSAVSYILNEVEDHYMEVMTLRSLADKVNYSPNYLGYLFRQETGKSFNEYLIEYRMKVAVELLKDSKFKIYEVADKVSYKNMNAFNNQFKKYYKMTPKTYRNQYLKH